MKQPMQLTNAIPSVRTSPGRSPLRRRCLLGALALAGCALATAAQGADGGLLDNNTAEGDGALSNLTTGFGNTAIGYGALYNDTTGDHNTASGLQTLIYNTTGNSNTADGSSTLFSNTTGSYNTASGRNALYNNTTGYENTANGYAALTNNTIGRFNTANGVQALYSNTTGAGNAANGSFALSNNGTGTSNTANGFDALFNNTTGSNNVAVGVQSGLNLTTGSNNIDIGNQGVAGEAGKIRIGTKGTHTGTFIAGISGVGVTGSAVLVNSSGKLGIMTSSARFKEAIKPMDKASEAILSLQPVTFLYKHDLDPDGIPQFGLIAEQVEKVDPNLVVRDEDGEIYTVRYEAVNAMLLNEFLKEHRKVEEQEATITQLKSTVAQQQKDFQATAAQQQKQIEALAATVQKVSDQVALSKPAPQLAANGE